MKHIKSLSDMGYIVLPFLCIAVLVFMNMYQEKIKSTETIVNKYEGTILEKRVQRGIYYGSRTNTNYTKASLLIEMASGKEMELPVETSYSTFDNAYGGFYSDINDICNFYNSLSVGDYVNIVELIGIRDGKMIACERAVMP